MQRDHTRRLLLWSAVALGITLALALLKLPTPFCGDTANFHLAARMLDEGGILYVDFWDMKQPGIYWFFLAARTLFGASQMAPRLLELVVLLAFAMALVAMLRRYLAHAWLAAVVPLAAIGSYYAAASDWHLTQAEFIVGVAIFLSAWLLTWEWQGAGNAIATALAGAIAAMAVVFKLAFAPIFVGFVLVTAWQRASSRRAGDLVASLMRSVVPFALGVAVILGIIAAIFAVNGALGELIWNAFVFPAKAYREVTPAAVTQLVKSILWFALAMAPWLVFAAAALPALARRDEPLMSRLMATWLVVGLAVILVQRFSWWEYHFLLLFLPVAVLAVRGIDLLLLRLRAAGVGNGLLHAASLLLVLPAFANTLQEAAINVPAFTQAFVARDGGGTEGYRRAVSGVYAEIADRVAAVRDEVPPGPVYVFGNPLVYLLLGRTQAIPTQGWGWEWAISEQWQRLAPDLQAAAPPVIYLSHFYRPFVERRSPATMALLAETYQVLREDAAGTWYRRRG
jgi:hypothetical protein